MKISFEIGTRNREQDEIHEIPGKGVRRNSERGGIPGGDEEELPGGETREQHREDETVLGEESAG